MPGSRYGIELSAVERVALERRVACYTLPHKVVDLALQRVGARRVAGGPRIVAIDKQPDQAVLDIEDLSLFLGGKRRFHGLRHRQHSRFGVRG